VTGVGSVLRYCVFEKVPSPVFPGRLADVEGAFDVGVHIGVRGHIGIWDGDQGRQVKDHIDLFGDLLAEMRVPDTAAHGQQHFREVRADRTVSTGDKYSFHMGVRPALLWLLGGWVLHGGAGSDPVKCLLLWGNQFRRKRVLENVGGILQN